MKNSPSVAIVASSEGLTEDETKLASFLGVPITTVEQVRHSGLSFYLKFMPDGLALLDLDGGAGKPTVVDFSSAQLESRVSDSLAKQNLIKALGLKKNPHPRVLDGMAGLGKDAYLMAMAGCKVHMLEKSGVVYSLIKDGLDRLKQCGYLEFGEQALSLQFGDFLDIPPDTEKYDLVYLDPMYQGANKKSKAKRDIERLQRLLGKEDNEALLLQHGLIIAKRRVIVKRPKNAPQFAGKTPDIIYKGSSARFDVYLTS